MICIKCFARKSFLVKQLTCSITKRTLIVNEEAKFTEDKETAKFDKQNFDWWDLNGPMIALHTMNSVRVPFIRNCLLYQGIGEGKPHTDKPLKGVDLLEVGCGGGILSEALCRLGATVTAIDAAENAISAAKAHRDGDHELESLQYLNVDLEDIASLGSLQFDAVVASEVIEHVTDPNRFVNYCSSVIRPGGSLFMTTLNRTTISNILAVFAAEKIIRVVDDGTHDWNKFVSPEELSRYLTDNRCNLQKIHGLCYNPFSNSWSFIDSTDINYIIHAVKCEETDADGISSSET